MEEEITTGEYTKKWGLIFGLVSAIVFIITTAARLNLGFAGIAVSWTVIIVVLFFALKEFKSDNGGFLGFGQGFKMAFVIAVIGGLVRAVIQYVYLMIDTEFFAWQKEVQEESAARFGGPQGDQAQQMPEGMQSFMEFTQTGEFMAIVSILMAILGGLIFGAVVSAILKNEAEEF